MITIIGYGEDLPPRLLKQPDQYADPRITWDYVSLNTATGRYELFPNAATGSTTMKGKKASKKQKKTNQYKDTSMQSKAGKKPTKGYTPCWQSHPPLPVTINGKDYVIHGGSATQQVPNKDVDVFIGFDFGMKNTPRRFPWNKGEEIYFEIVDMSVPKDVKEFTQLLDYVHDQLLDGKKVFAGCIGGHGRTGLFMAAFVSRFCGEEDAITYVRTHYCDSAVETHQQVEWLHKHFNVKKVGGSKPSHHGYNSFGYDSQSYLDDWSGNTAKVHTPNQQIVVPPIHSFTSIHGENWNK